MKKIYFISIQDLIYVPPVIAIIELLSELGFKIILCGVYSDNSNKEKLINKGVLFKDFSYSGEKGNLLKRIFSKFSFRKKIIKFLKKETLSSNDLIWITRAESLIFFRKLTKNYKVIYHSLEFRGTKLNWRASIESPFTSLTKVVRNCYKVICCEYNRAQITKGIYNLSYLPYVLPNKSIIKIPDVNSIPSNVLDIINKIKILVGNRKIILYQGGFNAKERRLDEYCDAILTLKDKFVLILLGSTKDKGYYSFLKKKYKDENIIFIPFITPPYHLLITKLAYIGILTYFPDSKSFADVINPIYCAPNKIFEYSKFNLPMIGNNIPGLYYPFIEYNCGRVINYPLNVSEIINTIKEIDNNYDILSKGSQEFYKSVNMKQILHKIVEN